MSKEAVERALKRTAYDSKFGHTVLWSMVKDSVQYKNNILPELPDKHGKVAVVTGGSKGMGLHVVKTLMRCGMTVITGVRDTDFANKTLSEIEGDDLKGKVIVFELDLSSIRSVKSFAEKISKDYLAIDLLVNNAGALLKEHKVTEDGFENHFATNYLGHFLLTHLLLPQLKAAGDKSDECARIVNVSSCIHDITKIFFDDIHFTKHHYIPTAAYAQSKLAQLLSTRYLNKILEKDNIKVKVYAVHPGIVHTDMVNGDVVKNYARLLPKNLMRTAQQGAISTLYASLSTQVEGKGGIYIVNCTEKNGTEYSRKEDVQEKLFNVTCDMLNIRTFGNVADNVHNKQVTA